jgi:hypothetical protein
MIGFVDTTVRDGHQSLWSADALTTAMIAEVAPVMDRVGFRAIDFTSSTHMAMAVRAHAEDPWERIRVVRDRMPETPLGFITPGMRFMSWQRAPADVMRLALGCVIRNGIAALPPRVRADRGRCARACPVNLLSGIDAVVLDVDGTLPRERPEWTAGRTRDSRSHRDRCSGCAPVGEGCSSSPTAQGALRRSTRRTSVPSASRSPTTSS